jgi:uncharacterized protein (DUF3084 family)
VLVTLISGVGGVLGAVTALFTIFFTKNRLASEGKKFAAEADSAAVQAASGVMDMQKEIVDQQLAELHHAKDELKEAKERLEESDERLAQMTFRWAKSEDARQILQTRVERMDAQIVNLRTQVNALNQRNLRDDI